MLEILGDSHIIALRDAAVQEPKGSFSSRHGQIRMAQLGHGYSFLEPFFTFDGQSVSFTQAPARQAFEKLNEDDAPVIRRDDPRRFIFVFGLYPSFGFNAEHWTTHTTAAWATGRQFVTRSAFNAIIDETVRQPMAFFERLQGMGVRFSVASCCPVPASYHRLANKTNFADREVAFIYNGFRDRVAAQLGRLGIHCHLPPAEVYDADGAMLDVFSKSPGDYHGNPAYGRLMLSKILREADDLPAYSRQSEESLAR